MLFGRYSKVGIFKWEDERLGKWQVVACHGVPGESLQQNHHQKNGQNRTENVCVVGSKMLKFRFEGRLMSNLWAKN